MKQISPPKPKSWFRNLVFLWAFLGITTLANAQTDQTTGSFTCNGVTFNYTIDRPGNTSSFCTASNGSISITSVSTGTLSSYSYSWKTLIGVSAASTSDPWTLNTVKAGTYELTVTVNGVTCTQTFTMTYDNIGLPTVADQPVCSGSTATLTGSGCTTGYSWTDATGTHTGGSYTTPTLTSNYTVTVSCGTGTSRCPATEDAVNITVNPLPAAPTVSGTATICAGSSTTLSAGGCSGGTITWSNGSTGSSISVSTAGTYTATCTVTSNGVTCTSPTSSTSAVVTITPKTPLSFTAATICSGTAAPSFPSTSGISGSWNPSSVSNTATTTYTFTPDAGQCADPASWTVNVTPKTSLSFTAATICSGTAAPSFPATSGISGSWNPSSVSNTTTTTYTFTPDAGQCADPASWTVNVTPKTSLSFTAATICSGTAAPSFPATSGISGSWNPSSVSNTTTTTYTFTPDAGQCADPASWTVTITPKTPLSFTAATICSGTTAPSFPATSGISGSWNPSSVSNTTTTTYTFTPDAGQCADPASWTVTVTPKTPLSFTANTICSGTTAPSFPATSGISGSWNPSSVSNTTTTTYTFTPDAGQCADPASWTVTITPKTVLTFTGATICTGFTAPSFPSTSGIAGTWSPSTVSNTATTTYTFTPNADQCADPATWTVTITPKTVLSFTGATICTGFTAPSFPSTSGIAGTWSPSTVSNTATTTYTFTPNADQCASPASWTVTITPKTVLTFTGATICTGFTPPAFPSTSGIAGTWSPSTVSNTATTTYTFTPNADQCASPASWTVTITPKTVLTFTGATICTGSTAPAFPSTSGIAGTWSPSTVSNTATTTYTFTPNADQCASPATWTVTVISVPAPSISTDKTTACAASPATLTGAGCDGGTYTWSPGGATTMSITVTSAGSYTVTCTKTTDGTSCTSAPSAPTAITTVAPPTLNTGGTASFCEGSSLSITAGGCTGGTLSWSTGATTSTITVTAGGTYTATCTIGGCSASSSVVVTMNPKPTAPTISADKTVLCLGPSQTSIILTAVACDGPGSVLQWGSSDNKDWGNRNPLTVTQPGTYFATCKIQGCTSDVSNSITIIDCSILPVKIVSFVGKKDNEKISLKWRTSEEIAFSHFEVERALDALSFTTVGKVMANRKTEVAEYEFMDSPSNQNVIYYRLKCVDIDGTIAFSRTISVTNDAAGTPIGLNWSIYPNPVNSSENNQIYIYLEESDIEVKGMSLVTLKGRQFETPYRKLSSHLYEIQLDSSQPLGQSLLIIETDKGRASKWVFKY